MGKPMFGGCVGNPMFGGGRPPGAGGTGPVLTMGGRGSPVGAMSRGGGAGIGASEGLDMMPTLPRSYPPSRRGVGTIEPKDCGKKYVTNCCDT